MTKPLVSILIPVYNAGDYLRPALESVLHQTYKNLEIIIVDDGSTDGCMKSIADIKDSRIRIIRQQNSGKSAALNRALDIARGEYYAIQDADDLSEPQRIETLVDVVESSPHLCAVFSGYNLLLNEKPVAPIFKEKDESTCKIDIDQFRMPSHDPTGFYRMDMVKGIEYDSELRIGQGYDYILRVGEKYPMRVIPECLYSYRININSNTRSSSIKRNEMVQKVLGKAYNRRGATVTKLPEIRVTKSETYDYGLVPHFLESVLDLKHSWNLHQSFKTALFCMKLHPFDPYYYKPLCYFFIPERLINLYRSIKTVYNRPATILIKIILLFTALWV